MMTNQKNSPARRKHASLRVSKTSGQEAIRLLSEQHLVDQDYRVESSEKHVYIPLTRKLSQRETEELRTRLGTIDQIGRLSSPRSRPVRTLRAALQSRIPETVLQSLPSSFDIIGDIAVLDLSPEMSAYEKDIAVGIRQVNRNVSVVLTKTGSISGPDRVLPTRIIAGENRTVTLHRESGCRFKVDISRAYFSPRLSNEHARVTSLVEDGEVVTDLFAGVGPFSVMIAKKLSNVEVNAVDANPAAVELIRENQALNKVKGKLNVWLGDARNIVEASLAGKASRVIMNHPSAAREFVDVACNALREEGGMIHYYTFTQGEDCEAKAVSELEETLARFNWRAKWLAQARRVREVGPMKWQIVVDAPVAPLRPD